MVNPCSYSSRCHSAHIQRAIPFVSSTGRQAQSLVVDSTGEGKKGGELPLFGAFIRAFREMPTLFFSLFLPLSLDTLHVARVEEIHARRCILEQSFPENPPPPPSPSLPFLASSIPLPRADRGLEIYAPRISLLVCAPRSYGSRRSLERTARIEISRLDTSTSVIPVERKASLLSRDLSAVLITLSLRRISPRRTFHVYTAIISFMKSRVFFNSALFSSCHVVSRCFVIFLFKKKKERKIVFDDKNQEINPLQTINELTRIKLFFLIIDLS